MIRRSTWIVVGVFILLLAIAFFWQRYEKEQEAMVTPTTDQEVLLNLKAKITGLRIEGVGAKIVDVARDEQGQWKLVMPEGHETDTGSVEAVVTQLSTLRILSNFEQGIDLGGAGLVVPAYRITIADENGQQVVLNVGKVTATGSGYYVQMSGEGVYVVSKYSLDSILNLLENPPIKPTPTPLIDTDTLPTESATPPVSTEEPALTSTP